MKILRIERQKKDKERYSLFTENGYLAGVSEDTLVKFGLRAGDDIEDAKLKEMEIYEDFATARKDAYIYIAYKPRTVSEVEKKLRAKKHSPAAIQEAVHLLKEQKYLDDRAYALSYLAEKSAGKPVGRELLRRKLLQKGIEREILESILEEALADTDEAANAMNALKKYAARSKEEDPAKLRAKCFRHLVSRGFAFDTAVEVTRAFLESD